MSFFDQAFEGIKNNNLSGDSGIRLFEDINSAVSNNDMLNITNAMRSSGAKLPSDFPSFDSIFSSDTLGEQFPLTKLQEGIESSGLKDTVPQDLGNAFDSFSGFFKDGSLNEILGENAGRSLMGGERSFLSAINSAPKLLDGAERFLPSDIAGSTKGPAEALELGGKMSETLGSNSLGGILGSLGMEGAKSGAGGILGSLSGILGEGGIGSLIEGVTEIISKVLPLIMKLAPMALMIL